MNLHPSRTRWPDYVTLLGIVLLTIVAYYPALRGELIWDDDVHVAKQALHSMNGLRLIWIDPAATQQYYPLSHTVFWLQWLMYGERPMGYHIVNVALHVLNTLLFWRVLKRLAVPGAMLAAGIFAVHPVHVESVAWITELKNTLMGAFCLLSLLAYFRFNPPEASEGERLRWQWYAPALLLFVAGLLSKTVAASLPAAILVILWWKRGRLRIGRDMAPLAPWLAIGAALGLMIVHFERVYWGSRPENFGGEFFNWTLTQRTLVAGWALWFYVGKLFWPHPLAFFYRRWPVDAGDWHLYVGPTAAIGLVVVLWLLRKRIGRGPLAAALLFGGTLFPALGFFNLYWQIYSYVADHMQYIPSLSIFALIAGMLARIGSRLRKTARLAGAFACVGIIGALAGLTWKQCHIYQNLEALYSDTIAKSPDSWLANYNFGLLMHAAGQKDKAEHLLRRAIEIRPAYEDAHYVLGNILTEKGLDGKREALRHFAIARDLYIQQSESQRRVAEQLLRNGRAAEATRHEEFARLIRAKEAQVVYNCGNVYRDLTQLETAMECFHDAAALDSTFEEPLNNLGALYASMGKHDEAINAYRKAAAINPSNAAVRFNLGSLLADRGSATQAVVELRQALQINRSAVLEGVRAVARRSSERGRHADTVRYYDLILEVAPDDAAAESDRDRAALMGGSLGQP
jgi:protein O-mannosyl-transferase